MTKSENPERDIDVIIRLVHQQIAEAEVTQLWVKLPADDDNLWWFNLPGSKRSIQIEGACCPFLLETDEQCCREALKATTIDEAVEMIVTYLKLAKGDLPVRLEGQKYWSGENLIRSQKIINSMKQPK